MEKTALKIQNFGELYLFGDFMWFCDYFVSFSEIIDKVQ